VEEKPKVSKFKVMTPEEIKAKALADFEAEISKDAPIDMELPF